jgi:hypothetical protein
MKTTLWASCPKCQTELKIETDEPELVQIDCPDCHKVFAARVPARSTAPLQDAFSQMPVHIPAQMTVLPPFQPARVHYKARPKSDGSLSPAVITALIVVCASAILLPLGLGGYYFYCQLSEFPQIASSDAAAPTTKVSSQPSSSNTPSNEPPKPADPGFKDISAQDISAQENSAQAPPPGRKTPPPGETVGAASSTTPPAQMSSMTPADVNSSPDADSKIFGVPELNPPMIVQSNPSTPQVTPLSNSTQGTNSPTTPTPVTFGNSNALQGQVSVAGPGMSKSGLPVAIHRFVGSSGVLVFVLHSNGHSVANGIQELQRNLSISEIHAEGGNDHTTIGIRYSGSVDSVVKGIRFGHVLFADEESRSIHVQVN